jgi:hypothetical protein
VDAKIETVISLFSYMSKVGFLRSKLVKCVLYLVLDFLVLGGTVKDLISPRGQIIHEIDILIIVTAGRSTNNRVCVESTLLKQSLAGQQISLSRHTIFVLSWKAVPCM